jgi:hypothetical protein
LYFFYFFVDFFAVFAIFLQKKGEISMDKKGKGRPTVGDEGKYYTISTRLDAGTVAAIDAIAAEDKGAPARAVIIRRAVMEYIERYNSRA